ncbi:MAG: HNH endonuclease [Micromonosporaceae bacterium]|nr:HNH endonuclease [Micromonosporaceae bacterium]
MSQPIPGARFAFTVVHPGSPMLQVRYRQGVVVDGHGFPEWLPYARAVVALPDPAPGRHLDEARVLDVLTANLVMAYAGDPLWTDDALRTPDGWAWAHLASGRRVALVPVELHGGYRHLGGVATMPADRTRRGVQLGAERVPQWPGTERLAEEAVVKVEEHLGYRFPAGYREFLAGTNGGRPAAPAVHPRFGFVADQRLFGMEREDWHQDLVYANGWFGDRLTADFLAIGYVQGGLLAVKVRGSEAGSVWYLDDDDPRDTDAYDADAVTHHLLHRCAGDFAEFLAAMRVAPYPLRRLAGTLAQRGEARPERPDGMGTALPAAKRAPAAGTGAA